MDGTRWQRPTPLPAQPGDADYDETWLPYEKTSPLNGEALVKAMAGHPNDALREYISAITARGAPLGVNENDVVRGDGPPPLNLPSARTAGPARTATLRWIDTEVAVRRLRGPFKYRPHSRLRVWPVGAIPKGWGIPLEEKARVITHFSYGDRSLNAAIDSDCAEMCYLRYMDVVDAVMRCATDGRDVWLVATDLRDAFRIVQVAREHLHLQGLHVVRDDGTEQWFYDGHLGFGTRTGPRVFDSVASAIHWVLQARCDEQGLHAQWFHLLDDFLAVCGSRGDAAAADAIKTALLEELGIPEQRDKVQPPCQRLKYLGLILDTLRFTLSAPDEKRAEMTAALQDLAAQGSILTSALGRVTGQLSFYGVAFPRLRPLIYPLYGAHAMAERRGWRLAHPTKQARADAAVVAAVLRSDPVTPLSDFYLTPFTCDDVASIDASGPDGCGGFSLKHGYVFHSPWPAGFQAGDDDVSTCLQEMVAAAVLVDRAPEGSSLAVFTDSAAMKGAFANGRSPSTAVNTMLRRILTTCATRSVHLVVAWHRRDTSIAALTADALSRGATQVAFELVPALSGARQLEVTAEVHTICKSVLASTPERA